MKIIILSAVFTITLGACMSGLAADSDYSRSSDRYVVKVSGKSVHDCRLSKPIEMLRLSSDKQFLIVSYNSYVGVSSLESCAGKVVQTSALNAKNGLLMDINSRQKTYLSLISVSTQPMSFVAFMGKIDAPGKNLLEGMPGAYRNLASPTDQAGDAFSFDDSQGRYGTISVTGRYVAPDGFVDCSENSYPGVWDIEKKVKVITDDESCSSLFK
ncbi:hypothetical protein XOCgx_4229 [Xanthomonas oryzae pv. oryzicola]|nr:hypothetical protein XOCgx_4229 [Xanthomonas oryzae pv. oryzicola]